MVAKINRRNVQKKVLVTQIAKMVCGHSPRARHLGVLSQVILGSITTNKDSRGDEIPAELFKTLKDDAVKVLHSICQQI